MTSNQDLVFVDTSAFAALIANSDSMHNLAILILAELAEKKARLLTSEAVLFELANGFSKTRFRTATAGFIDNICANLDIEITWATHDLFAQALQLYRSRPDKDWSLTDCASFAIMKERGISAAFTSDKHFEQAGFVKLLKTATGS